MSYSFKYYFILASIFFMAGNKICYGQRGRAANESTPLFADSALKKEYLERKYNIRCYPLSLGAGQLAAYTMEFRLVFEYRFKKNNSIQFGAGADIPGIALVGQFPIGDGGQFPEVYWGGRGNIEYRHYFNTGASRPPNMPFVGAGVSVNGMATNWMTEGYYVTGQKDPVASSPYFRAHGIMSNYYVSGGSQFASKRRREKNYRLIEIGATVGYRYDYFWRHYPGLGNLEFDKSIGSGFYQTGYYHYLKSFPFCGSIDFSLGGAF